MLPSRLPPLTCTTLRTIIHYNMGSDEKVH
nr:MAG TPA: hypothetical protein [Bacteriophage sp.]DAW61091.1 MAG TPA: hypothetical protein [Caudoviricetes sp.]